MRIVLVGNPAARARLKQQLAGTGLEIAGEAASVGEARRMNVQVDGFLLAASSRSTLPEIDALTARELEVLQLVAEGFPNKRIGSALGISDQTVKFHLASLCGKLGALNRTEAVGIAIRHGLIFI